MNIVILGGSPAGVKIIEEIRQHDSSADISIISFDGHYPNKRDAFTSFIGKETTPTEVFYKSKDFYEKNNVNVVLDKKISRINLRRKKIFMENKEQIDYDILVITDTSENRFPNIKGTNKGNVFGYKKLGDVDKIVNALPIIKTVVIQSDSFSGLQAAASFVKREKEVILVSSEHDFLGRHFSGEALDWLVGQFEVKGLRIMRASTISEILGDKEAKAIKLGSGKVFASEVILFMETDEDLRLFSGLETCAGQKIDVDDSFKAKGIEGLFVADQVCSLSEKEPVTPLVVLEEQGKKIAAVIAGKDLELALPTDLQSFKMEDLAVTIIGQVQEREGIVINQVFDQESGRYKRFYLEDNCLIGAVLMNSEDEVQDILRKINEKVVFEAACDVPQSSEDFQESESPTADINKENVSTELVDN